MSICTGPCSGSATLCGNAQEETRMVSYIVAFSLWIVVVITLSIARDDLQAGAYLEGTAFLLAGLLMSVVAAIATALANWSW